MRTAPSPTQRSRCTGLMAIAAPLVLLQIARVVTNAVPEHARGSVVAGAPALLPAVETPAPMTMAQTRAVEWIRQTREDAIGANPFASPKIEPVVEAPREPAVIQAPAQEAETPPPNLKITSFFGKGDGAMVTINRRVHKPGDEVAAGWTLKSLDPAARTVRIRHEDGREIEVSAAGVGSK